MYLKKSTLFFLFLLALVWLVTACSGQDENETPSEEAAESAAADLVRQSSLDPQPIKADTGLQLPALPPVR